MSIKFCFPSELGRFDMRFVCRGSGDVKCPKISEVSGKYGFELMDKLEKVKLGIRSPDDYANSARESRKF